MRKWRIEDSAELYNIEGWGINYFSINEKGNVVVTPRRNHAQVDLKELVEELQVRDVSAPMLIRFPDILDDRIETMSSCFKIAAEEYKYNGQNFIIYPIKVNQMRPIVEEIVNHGKKFNIGLEAGSKPELHAVLAVDPDAQSIIIAMVIKMKITLNLRCWRRKWERGYFL
jgi:arginine decarboxylase